MKRRQYLAGVGSVLGGASVFGAMSQSSCTDDAHEWAGKVEDTPISTQGGEITLTLDGFTKQDVSWSSSNGQYFGNILVSEPSCGSVNEVTIPVPDSEQSHHRLFLLAKTKDSIETVIAQYVRKDGKWVPIETSDID